MNQLVVSDRIPLPARKLLALVQQVLKVNQTEAVRVIQQGAVLVNNRPLTRPLTTLEVGDRLAIDYQPRKKPEDRRVPSRQAAAEVRIVFQDDHLLVVDKPAGLLTVPTPRQERETLIGLLEQQVRDGCQTPSGAHFRGAKGDSGRGEEAHFRGAKGDYPRGAKGDLVFCVHRLDRGVSGLLVFGKSLEIAQRLRSQFEARKPKRRYVAIIAGQLEQAEGTFQSYLATDEHLNRYSTDQPSEGQWAVTHFRVLHRLTTSTVVEVVLETGRRNQIRVHFAEAGHAVLGDRRYASEDQESAGWLHSRLALHAQTLGFTHPVSGRPLEFHSPLPEEMRTYLERAGVPLGELKLDRPLRDAGRTSHSPRGDKPPVGRTQPNQPRSRRRR